MYSPGKSHPVIRRLSAMTIDQLIALLALIVMIIGLVINKKES